MVIILLEKGSLPGVGPSQLFYFLTYYSIQNFSLNAPIIPMIPPLFSIKIIKLVHGYKNQLGLESQRLYCNINEVSIVFE